MQMWPDADFHLAHRHGVTAYAVTAWDPHATPDSAMEGILYWHWVAREYPHLPLVRSVADIRRNIEQRILIDTLNNRQKIRSNYPTTDNAIITIRTVLGWKPTSGSTASSRAANA